MEKWHETRPEEASLKDAGQSILHLQLSAAGLQPEVMTEPWPTSPELENLIPKHEKKLEKD